MVASRSAKATLKSKIISCVPGREKNGQSGGQDFFFFFLISFCVLKLFFYGLECTESESKYIYFFF